MPMGGAQFSLTATRILQGRVVDVDPDRWCLEVGKLYTVERLMDVPYSTPYMGFRGEGINFMPEVGGTVWICDPSDARQSFVLAWSPPAKPKDDPANDEGTRPDYSCNRPQINPGDIVLSGADRNFMALRRGGLLEMGATKLCQQMFIPVGNIIKTIAQRYEVLTVPGELKFECDSDKDHPDGKAPTRVRLKVKKYANDSKPLAEVLIGEDPNQSGTGVISFQIFDPLFGGGLAAGKIELNETGDLTCTLLKGVLSVTAKSVMINGIQNVSLTAGTALTLSAPQLAIAAGGAGGGISFPGDGSVGLKATKIKNRSNNVELCSGATDQAVKGNALISWLVSHKHIGIPSVGVSGGVSPDDAARLTGILSTKVRLG